MQIGIPTSEDVTVEYKYEFRKKALHITNYVERECLKAIRFFSEDFNRIGINLNHENEEPYIFNDTLIIPVNFIKTSYDKQVLEGKFQEYIIQILHSAFHKVAGLYNIPTNEMIESLNTLKDNRFVNKWLYKRKVDKNKKLKAELHCSLTIQNFQLTFIVNRGNEILFKDVVLTTDPDEIAFGQRFKDILIDDEKIIVTSSIFKNLLVYYLQNNRIKISR